MSYKNSAEMLSRLYDIYFNEDGEVFHHFLRGLRDYVTGLEPSGLLMRYASFYFNSDITDNEEKLAAAIDFAEKLRLSDMAFVVTADAADFLIQDKRLKTEMSFSNRDSHNGEIRGALLRERLEALKQENDALTLADALRMIYGERNFATTSEAVYATTGAMAQMGDEYIDDDDNRAVFRASVQPFIGHLGQQLITQYPDVFEAASDDVLQARKDEIVNAAKACFHQSHDYWYTKCIKHNQLDIEKMISLLEGHVSPTMYRILGDILRANSDAQFNIISRLNEKGEWVRDATYAMSLEAREAADISNDAPVIVANNLLLRALSRVRAIDYAIEKKYAGTAQKTAANTVRIALQSAFKDLLKNTLSAAQHSPTEAGALRQMKALEVDFNRLLIEKLHEVNLAQGIKTEQAAEKLLNRYRNLSSLLTPARPLVTLTYDTKAAVFQRETQYPVTQKTSKQKAALAALSEQHAYDSAKAADEADRLFSDLMAADDRALPAQTRKTHLLGGAKNAFLVKNELIFDVAPEDLVAQKDKTASDEHTLWMARMGTPVYVGKRATDTTVASFTRENIAQVRKLAEEKMGKKSLDVHFTTLNTDSPLENQSLMIRHLYDATRRDATNGDTVSYVPTNPDGTFRLLDVAPEIYPDGDAPTGSAPLDKAKRARTATNVALKAVRAGYLSVISCASGQDRTGTVVEAATQAWTAEQYRNHRFLDSDNMPHTRGMGAHATEASTHLAPGSPMIKLESRAGRLFDEAVTRALYGQSAKTNKKSPVTHDNSTLRKLKNKVMDTSMDDAKYVAAHHLAMMEYEQNMRQYEEALIAYQHHDQIFRVGRSILAHAREVGGALKVKTKDLAQVNQILFYCTELAKQPGDATVAFKLQALSEQVSGKASPVWQKIANGLLIFAMIALVVAVVATLAFCTGGVGLLVPLAAATGLSLIKIAGVCAVGGGVMFGTSAALEKHSEAKGLARDVATYTSFSPHMQHSLMHHEGNEHKQKKDEQDAPQSDDRVHPHE